MYPALKYATFATLLIIILMQINAIYCNYDYYTWDNENMLINYTDIQYRTGDIIFTKFNHHIFNYNTKTKKTSIKVKNAFNYSNIFSSTFTDKHFTHMGIIIVLNNVPYVYEISTVDKTHLTPRFIDFESYINNYKGHVYHINYTGPELDTSVYNKFKETNKNKLIFDITPKFIYNFINAKTNDAIDNYDSITCCALVAYLLKENNLFHDINCFRARPSTFKKYIIPRYYGEMKLLRNKYSIECL